MLLTDVIVVSMFPTNRGTTIASGSKPPVPYLVGKVELDAVERLIETL